ncbi:hypothetical protein [Herpetosiphon geysericola]|uniref:Uncharacterized protein n=1 Tax=Herpetosiphon geysericola TaxID=70996 RepID=A0A0P6XHL0_9CHLR|nr:hypothetical protein [Herpetosiphon geysericola]KPL83025.1 hypothetical protein SE18_19475 [Herpetosiphon geysericola]
MKRLIGILMVVLVAALAGWAWTRTLPMATAAAPRVAESAMVDGGGYGIYGWDGGLQVVLIYEGTVAAQTCDIDPADGAADEVYRCTIPFANGTTTQWSIRSADGKTGRITVDGVTYAVPREATVLRINGDGVGQRVTAYQRILPPLTLGDASRTLEQWMARDAEFAPFAALFRSE